MSNCLAQAQPLGQLESAGRAAIGLGAGCLLAWAVAALLAHLNLRPSFAVPVAMVGYAVLVEFHDTLYGIALLVGGIGGAHTRRQWIARDLRDGGESARRAREALSPRELWRNRRDRARVAKQGALVDRSGLALGTDERGAVVRLPLGLTDGKHTLLIGATGAGKTTTLLWVVLRHLDAGCGAILIDPKGDPALIEQCRTEALSRGRPFYCFSLDSPQQRWNPVAAGRPSEQTDKLIAAEEWTEPHYKRLYQRYLLNAFMAIRAREEEADLGKVIELLDPDRLSLYCRDIDDHELAERLSAYLAALTPDEARSLGGLRNRLAILVEGEHEELLRPAADVADEIDLFLAINQGAVVVFSLSSSRYPETVKLLAAALFKDLKYVAGVLESEPALKRPTAVAVDEFAAFGADNVLGLFQRARSARLSLLLATQELADLRRVDESFQDQLLGNVETIVAHRQNVPSSAELVAQLAGTRETWIHTFQTDDNQPGTSRDPESGLGTRRRGHEFLIPPGTVKTLATGQAVVVTKNPHTARVVRVYQLEPTEARGVPVGELAEPALRLLAFERMYPPDISTGCVEPSEEEPAA